MATNRSLDSLVEAANMIEKKKGEKGSSSRDETDCGKDFSGDCEYSRSLSSRINHNVLERNRRAQMRQNFNSLQKILPKLSGQKKVSNVCILKAATNEIQKLLDDDNTYRREKEKLRESRITLIAKLQKLQGSSKATGLEQTNLVNEFTGSSSVNTSENVIEAGTRNPEIGVNTDFDTDDCSLQDSDDIQIEIED